MNSTEKTPGIGNFDDSFLNDVNKNIADSFNRLSITDFKKFWAERLFSNPTEDKSDLLKEWEYQVALGRNVPVFITDVNGEDTWLFPPLIGSIKSRFTATEHSMSTLNAQVEILRKRILRQGIAAEESLYSSFTLDAEDKTFNDVNLFMLRRECGYLTEEEERLFQKVVGKINPLNETTEINNTNDGEEEEYEY